MKETEKPLQQARWIFVRPEIITEPLPTAVHADEFTPRLLALLSNALIGAQTRSLREQVGLGTNSWRVIAALASQPAQSAAEISQALTLNKGNLSKSVSELADHGYIVLGQGPRGSRPLYLTGLGAQLHDRMLPIALRGQELVNAELDAEGVRELNALLRRLTDRARLLDGAPPMSLTERDEST